MHTIPSLLHESQHAVVVAIPKVGQLGGIWSFVGRALNSDLTTLSKCIHVVLAAACDGIPRSAIGDAIRIGVRHIRGIDLTGELHVFSANIFPPILIRVLLENPVPTIVHHLGTAVVVGRHGEKVFICKRHGPLSF